MKVQVQVQQIWQALSRRDRTHKSRQVELALARLGGRVRLHSLPPYCPDHHRIERAWRDLHANVTAIIDVEI